MENDLKQGLPKESMGDNILENSSESGADSDSKAEELSLLKEELDKKSKEAEEYLDLLKRVQADFDNYRKRILKEKEEWINHANEQLILQLLTVMDDFERAFDLTENASDINKFIDGFKMIYNQLANILKKNGVEEIECLGMPFDPYKHHAIMQVECEGVEENTVVEVLQKGYMLKNKVIRPSLVKVSK